MNVKEETLRVIFQPSFSILGTQGSSYRVIRTAKVGCTGSKITMFCNFRALNKLLGPFKLILSKWDNPVQGSFWYQTFLSTSNG